MFGLFKKDYRWEYAVSSDSLCWYSEGKPPDKDWVVLSTHSTREEAEAHCAVHAAGLSPEKRILLGKLPKGERGA